MRRPLIPTAVLALLLTALPATAGEFHIVDGQPADPGEYPAQAALVLRDEGFQFCGGTLIDAEWVLTAAHCFYDSRTGGSSIPPSALEIVLDATDWTAGGERIGVDRITIHPEYDEFLTTNDIALLHLSAPAATAPAVVVTAEQADLYAHGRPAVVTGYGTTSSGGEPSDVLLEAGVPLVDDSTCRLYYPDLADVLHTCAGGGGSESDPGPDTCQGDSGGPLWTDRGDGVLTLIGITSFGSGCGFEPPGVYTELATYLAWVAGTMDGSIPDNTPTDPTLPEDPEVPAGPSRITADADGPTEAVAQAIAVSRTVFPDGMAEHGVVATSARYPDALGGSSLAYGVGPLLFTDADGSLGADALAELRRAVRPGGQVWVLGGTAVIPDATLDALHREGFQVSRVAGAGREETAALVAEEVTARFDGIPLDTVIVATGGNWPDAVTVGQIGSWWGVPILLTTPGSLSSATADFLARHRPATVLVAGGSAAVDDTVVAAIEDVTSGAVTHRLGGATRFETAAEVARYDLDVLFGSSTPSVVVAVNLQREADAFAHVLSATMLTGAFGGVLAPVGGPDGAPVVDAVLDVVCGLAVPVVAAGGHDLVSDDALGTLAAASQGSGCDATGGIAVGEATSMAITPELPSRFFEFQGVAGQHVRIRMDADAFAAEEAVDPLLRLTGPDGELVAENDDSEEEVPSLNALLDVVLPADGTYRIEATSFGGTVGRFVLTLDPAPALVHTDELTEARPEVAYPVTGPPGAQLVVEMRNAGASTDPLLVILDGAGEVLAVDDDGGGFPNSRVSVRIPDSGQLTVLAGAYEGFTGAYQLYVYDPQGAGITFG